MKAAAISTLLVAVLATQAAAQPTGIREFDQQAFAEAYNRRNADAMAMAFSEDATRVTPSGIFEGRNEIRRSFQDALDLGIRDYTVNRTGSRSYGDVVLNVGEWHAKLGKQLFRGYYTAILGPEGDQIKILQETVTVATPDR